MRLFFGVPLDADARRGIVDWTERWKRKAPEVRWTSDGTLHVTLLFLGEVSDGEVGDIERTSDAALKAVLADAVSAPAPFLLSRPGCFLHPPRAILWLGVEDPGWIAATAHALARALSQYSPDAARAATQSFTAHVTLARARNPRKGRARFDRFLEDYVAASGPDLGPQSARVVLFRSDLRPGGATHAPIREWDLSRRLDRS